MRRRYGNKLLQMSCTGIFRTWAYYLVTFKFFIMKIKKHTTRNWRINEHNYYRLIIIRHLLIVSFEIQGWFPARQPTIPNNSALLQSMQYIIYRKINVIWYNRTKSRFVDSYGDIYQWNVLYIILNGWWYLYILNPSEKTLYFLPFLKSFLMESKDSFILLKLCHGWLCLGYAGTQSKDGHIIVIALSWYFGLGIWRVFDWLNFGFLWITASGAGWWIMITVR